MCTAVGDNSSQKPDNHETGGPDRFDIDSKWKIHVCLTLVETPCEKYWHLAVTPKDLLVPQKDDSLVLAIDGTDMAPGPPFRLTAPRYG